MDMSGVPMTPLVLAFILGEKIEEYLRKGMTYSSEGFAMFFTRPVSLIFLLVAAASILLPVLKPLFTKGKLSKEWVADD